MTRMFLLKRSRKSNSFNAFSPIKSPLRISIKLRGIVLGQLNFLVLKGTMRHTDTTYIVPSGINKFNLVSCPFEDACPIEKHVMLLYGFLVSTENYDWIWFNWTSQTRGMLSTRKKRAEVWELEVPIKSAIWLFFVDRRQYDALILAEQVYLFSQKLLLNFISFVSVDWKRSYF